MLKILIFYVSDKKKWNIPWKFVVKNSFFNYVGKVWSLCRIAAGLCVALARRGLTFVSAEMRWLGKCKKLSSGHSRVL